MRKTIDKRFGARVDTLEQLVALKDAKRAVICRCRYETHEQPTPAAWAFQWSGERLYRLLSNGNMSEYIKPVRKKRWEAERTVLP